MLYARNGEEPTERRVGIYTRISRTNNEGDRLGVERQEQDGRADCGRRRWQVVRVYEDNDISGSGKVHRADYSDLVRDLREDVIDAAWAWDLDRLHRGFPEYVAFYQICEARRAAVAWLGGTADFATGRGLLEMELRATFAREELRKMRQRVKRKHVELLESGTYIGAKRTFGFQFVDDVMVVVPEEADLIREAVRRALEGESLSSICRDWMERGVRTTKGNAWDVVSMRRLLASGRISGRRDYTVGEDGKRRLSIPRIVGPLYSKDPEAAAKLAIVSPADSDRIRAILAGKDKRVNREPRRYLLASGLSRCGRCGSTLQPHRIGLNQSMAGVPTLECSRQRGACGRLRIMYLPLERLVVEAVLAACEGGALEPYLLAKDDLSDLLDALGEVEKKLADLSRRWADDQLTTSEWEAAREVFAVRRGELQRQIDARRRRNQFAGLPSDLRGAWSRMPLHQQRAVVTTLVDSIVVRPASRRSSVFDPSRISIQWRA